MYPDPTPTPPLQTHTVPLDASIAQIEAAVLQEYGSHLHTAMRGPTGNSRYFRQLTKTLIPLLLPEQVLQSRYVHCRVNNSLCRSPLGCTYNQ